MWRDSVVLWIETGMEGAIHAVYELLNLHSDDGWRYCLLMQKIISTLLFMWLHYGMLELIGLSVLAFCLIPIGDKPDYLFRVLIKFCLLRKV